VFSSKAAGGEDVGSEDACGEELHRWDGDA
jgi:hypothetical protein